MEAERTELENAFQKDVENVRKELSESELRCKKLEEKINELSIEMKQIQDELLEEKNEKNIALLKNAEIQQSHDLLKQELREERNDRYELNDRNQQLESENRSIKIELMDTKNTLIELQDIMEKNQIKLNDIERLEKEIYEKNTVKYIIIFNVQFIFYISIFLDNRSIKFTFGGFEENAFRIESDGRSKSQIFETCHL